MNVTESKPAADLTVWGILLMVIGNGLAGIVAYNSFLESISSFSSGGDGYETWIFICLALGTVGFIMMLIGIHRFISRTDPRTEPTEVELAERLSRVDHARDTSNTAD